MINKSTNINKANNHLSPQIIEYIIDWLVFNTNFNSISAI